MTDDALRRAADAAMLPIVMSLAPAGVLEAHWLSDREGVPVVWILVRTEIARVEVEAQSWVLPQVQITLARLGVRPDRVLATRLQVTSVESQDRLFEE